MTQTPILSIALPIPAFSTFDYLWDKKEQKPTIGSRVIVTARHKKYIGIVTGYPSKSNYSNLKSIERSLDQNPVITEEIFQLSVWASNYYHKPIGEVLLSILPKALRQGKNLIRSTKKIYSLSNIETQKIKLTTKQQHVITLLKDKGALDDSQFKDLSISKDIVKRLVDKNIVKVQLISTPTYKINDNKEDFLDLNDEQKNAFIRIKKKIDDFAVFLLYGITGSGKTEVYFHAMHEALKNDKQILYLVPEIGLTPQLISRLSKRFHQSIALFHSDLTETQKLDNWFDSKENTAKIIIGTRSALFTPMPNLGLIIVDEEHDSSYKQTERFRYHARDLAIMRAKFCKIPVVLGSATPSLHSMHNANTNKYELLKLTKRATGFAMPNTKIIDMRHQNTELAEELLVNIKEHLENGSQVLMFLNRRGFAPLIICPNCGFTLKCHQCDSHLTYHKSFDYMLCHSCTAKQKKPAQCTSCRLSSFKLVGLGTERLAEILTEHFPKYPIIRIDQDTTSTKGSFERHIQEINKNKPMILVGTQMLAKGHHFPNVKLVAILGIDNGLYSSDFYAIERTMQTITQVAGRAGRESIDSEVFIQTLNPDNMVFDESNMDYLTLSQKLLEDRKLAQLPPYSLHAIFIGESTNDKDAKIILDKIAKLITHRELKMLGPIPAIQEKRQGFYRYHLVIQYQNRKLFQQIIQNNIHKLSKLKTSNTTRWILDINPIEMA